MSKTHSDEFSADEIALRMNNAVRRALNTPPKPLKEMVGKGKRTTTKGKNRVKKTARSTPK